VEFNEEILREIVLERVGEEWRIRATDRGSWRFQMEEAGCY